MGAMLKALGAMVVAMSVLVARGQDPTCSDREEAADEELWNLPTVSEQGGRTMNAAGWLELGHCKESTDPLCHLKESWSTLFPNGLRVGQTAGRSILFDDVLDLLLVKLSAGPSGPLPADCVDGRINDWQWLENELLLETIALTLNTEVDAGSRSGRTDPWCDECTSGVPLEEYVVLDGACQGMTVGEVLDRANCVLAGRCEGVPHRLAVCVKRINENYDNEDDDEHLGTPHVNTRAPTASDTAQRCENSDINVVVMLDASNSVYSRLWNYQKLLTRKLAGVLPLAGGRVTLQVVDYHRTSSMGPGATVFTSSSAGEIQEYTRNLEQSFGDTNIPGVLEDVEGVLGGGRRVGRRVAVLLSDGNPFISPGVRTSCGADTEACARARAQSLISSGVELIFAPIGDGPNEDLLDGTGAHVVTGGFNDIGALFEGILTRVCETRRPTAHPTDLPTALPSVSPTKRPTDAPTPLPTEAPSPAPTKERTITPQPTMAPTPPFRCGPKPVDVQFILDSSGSVSFGEWTELIDFVTELSSRFNIGTGALETRVSHINFSQNIESATDFSDATATSPSLWNQLLLNLNRQKSGTATGLALAESQNIWARTTVRPNIWRRAVVMMTDGQPNFNAGGYCSPLGYSKKGAACAYEAFADLKKGPDGIAGNDDDVQFLYVRIGKNAKSNLFKNEEDLQVTIDFAGLIAVANEVVSTVCLQPKD